jgi:hypothetical protein
MLKRKGIIGVGVVMSAMLGILLLGLAVSVTSPGGSLFESVSEGLGLVDEQVSSTIVIEGNEQEAKETFSDAARYVYHRASNNGCGSGGAVEQHNKEGGYAGLEGTHLGVKPPCAGSGGTFAASPSNAVGGDSGNDMEGVFSRVKFEISDEREQPLIFTKEGDTWIENNYLGASKKGLYESINNDCTGSFSTRKYFGVDSSFNFFFKSSGSFSRASIWMEDVGINENVYCQDADDIGVDAPVDGLSNEDVDVALCPGDKGYIQMNKGQEVKEGPNNKGESTEGEAYYPFIQITETGDCQAGLYEDNLEFEVTQDPKMVEDQLGLRMDGLFEYDDKVRFDFLKNGETIHQETVDVEGGVATAELTPGENGMNVGSYTVVPNILRCDDNGESCESPNVDITTGFEIENYKYYDSYNPRDGGLLGIPELFISINNEKDYSGSQPVEVNYLDSRFGVDLSYPGLQSASSSQCQLTFVDQDAVNNDHGGVFFSKGSFVQKEGSLPSRDGIPQDKTGGGPGDDSAWTVYDNFAFDGSQWEKSTGLIDSGPSRTLLVDSNEGKRFELVGDLLCAEREDFSRASWILCDESNVPEDSEFGEDYTIETNGREYLCEPDEGEWSQTGANIPDVISGVVTTDITEEMTDNPEVVEESESSITFRPAESDENDYLIWESLPEGDKSIEVTVNFEERGHLRIEARERAGVDSDIVNYLYTGVYGSSQVGFFQSSRLETLDYEYQTGEDITFRIERSGPETTWEIEEGGNTQWSETAQTGDFRRLSLGSWEYFSGNQAQSPVVTIKNVEIEDR